MQENGASFIIIIVIVIIILTLLAQKQNIPWFSKTWFSTFQIMGWKKDNGENIKTTSMPKEKRLLLISNYWSRIHLQHTRLDLAH